MAVMKALPLIALAAIMMIVGCGKKEETTVTTPDGTTVKTSNDGKDVNVSTPNGDVKVGGLTEADLGLPFYEGSTEDAMGASAKTEANGQTVAASMRTTKDDPGKVIDFYKAKVKNPVPSVNDMGGTKMGALAGELENGAKVAVTATKAGTEDTKITVSVTSTK
jgi:hypothetical protein